MNKSFNYLRLAGVTGAITLILPFVVCAQTAIDTTVAVGVGANIETNQEVNTRSMTQTIKNRIQGAADNGDYRNRLAEDRPDGRFGTSTMRTRPPEWNVGPAWLRSASSTRPLPPFLKRIASSTELEGHKDWKQTQLDRFAALQLRLVAEDTKALNKLKEARAKINSRIQKAESNGRDMTDAKNLLFTADAKILIAAEAIQTLSDYTPPIVLSASSTATDKSNVVLERPREIGAASIKALKDAKKALHKVVEAIAHGMGLKLGKDGRTEDNDNDRDDATTTPPITATTTISATTTTP